MFLQYSIVVFLGLMFGSLLNVIVNRMILMENEYLANIAVSLSKEVNDNVKEFLKKYSGYTLFKPNSTCPECGHEIRFYENIPVLSYLFLRGKCSSCKAGISVQYPLIEFLTMVIFTATYYYYGFSYEFLLHVSLFYFLFALCLTDIKARLIFDSYLIFVFALGFLTSSLVSYENGYWSFINAISVYFGLFVFISLFENIFKSGEVSFGRGDIKLIGALSVWLSLVDVMYMVIFSCLFGFAAFVLRFLFFKGSMRDYMPFAPSIVLGFLVVYFCDFNFI